MCLKNFHGDRQVAHQYAFLLRFSKQLYITLRSPQSRASKANCVFPIFGFNCISAKEEKNSILARELFLLFRPKKADSPNDASGRHRPDLNCYFLSNRQCYLNGDNSERWVLLKATCHKKLLRPSLLSLLWVQSGWLVVPKVFPLATAMPVSRSLLCQW